MRSLNRSSKLPPLIIALAVIMVLASRPTSGQSPWSWVTVKPPGENFSVRMPKQPRTEQIDMSNLAGTAYSATGGSIYYTVKSIRARGGGTPRSRLDDFIAKYRETLSSDVRLTDGHPVYLSGFVGQQYRIGGPSGRGLVRIYSTGQHIYVLEVAGGDEQDAPVSWFLDSFTITEPPPAPAPEQPSPRGGGTREPIRDPQPFPPVSLSARCECDPSGNPAGQTGADSALTRDAIICTKGDLELTDEAVKHQFSGDVILEVELLKEGAVGGIKVVQSQPYGLEQKAVEAAKQYKFCPALEDGQPVTQIMTLTCTFTVRKVYRQVPAKVPRGRRRP